MAGTHAYVAEGNSGLQVVDISNPASPVIVGSVDTPYTVTAGHPRLRAQRSALARWARLIL